MDLFGPVGGLSQKERYNLSYNMPLVSVIIPTYNRAHCITEAIDSVLAQSYQQFEIIVIDDGSDDDTKDKLACYANKIRYFYQENSGVSVARNLGIQEAHGEWVAFLDSDDIWEPDKLKVQVEDLCATPPAVAHMVDISILNGLAILCPSLFKLRRSLIEFSQQPFRNRPLLDVTKVQFFTSSWLVKRDVLISAGYFDPTLKIFEDFDMLSRVALEGPFVVNCYRGVVIRRRQSDILSLSGLYQSKRIASLKNLMHSYSRLKNDLRLVQEEHAQVCRSLGGVWGEVADEYRKRREWRNFILSLARSIKEDPKPRAVARALWYAIGFKKISPRRKGKNYLRRSEIGSQ